MSFFGENISEIIFFSKMRERKEFFFFCFDPKKTGSVEDGFCRLIFWVIGNVKTPVFNESCYFL